MLKLLSYTLLFLFPLISIAAQFERINYIPGNKQTITLKGSQPPSSNLPFNLAPGSTFVAKSKISNAAVSLTDSTHTRYQQQINGIPVWSAEMIVHSGKNNRVTGKILNSIDLNRVKLARYSSNEVYAHSLKYINKKTSGIPASDITRKKIQPYIYNKSNGDLVHAYFIDLLITSVDFISRPQIIIDATDLTILSYWDGLQHLEKNATGPGGNEKTGRYNYGQDFPNFIVNEHDGLCTMENNNIKAVDLNHLTNDSLSSAFEYACNADDSFENTHKAINGAFSPINDAYYFGNLVFNMYQDWYAISPLPIQLSMKVHYGNNVDNAFWTGDSMLFGDGNTLFYPLVDINISAHEVSHGFTEFNSNLIYSGESGGMNEAFSDIAGEAAEFYMKGQVDWEMGADVYRGEGALRYFSDPTLDGVSINHTDDYYNGLNVHYSSGIYNKAFYLLANTPGWTVKTAFDVFTYANQNYWIADETFINGACGTISSAQELNYSSLDVAVAFINVGITCPSIIFDDDQDSMNDIWEVLIGFDPESADDANKDFDNDGLTNLEEYQLGTKAKFNDSDWDGVLDGDELALTTNPLNSDSDADDMPDGFEVEYGLSPTTNDSAEDLDNDGLSNIVEFEHGLNPSIRDELIPNFFISSYTFDKELSSLWQTVGDFGWKRAQLDNKFVLASKDINDYQSAQVDINAQAQAGNVLTFDLKTSTEANYDYFILKIDGLLVHGQSGVHDWQTISHTFTQTGEVTVSFIYQKDVSISSGTDSVYIDNVEGLAPTPKDEDSNGIADYWQSFYGITDAILDPDNDGLNNLEEFQAFTSPLLADSDHDGLNDQAEINQHHTNPLIIDTDNDGISDYEEIQASLDALDKDDAILDSDADGYNNLMEALYSGKIQDPAIIPNSLLYINDTFSNPLATREWLLAQPYSLPSYEQYAYWQISDGKLQPQAIDNDMVAITSFRTLFEEGDLTFDLFMDTEIQKDELIVYIDGVIEKHFSGQVDEKIQLTIETGIHEVNFVYKKNSLRSPTTESIKIDNLHFIAAGDFDGDGLSNLKEAKLGTDLRNKDTDGDSYDDALDQFPNDASEWLDTDSDGYGDNKDIFPQDSSEWLDTDSDGYGDNKDIFPQDSTEWLDTDSDGQGDNKDAFPTDPTEWLDTDSDGHGDNKDTFPQDSSEWLDTDSDGHGDNTDRYPTNSNKWKKDKKKDEISLGAINYAWLGLFAILLSRRRSLTAR